MLSPPQFFVSPGLGSELNLLLELSLLEGGPHSSFVVVAAQLARFSWGSLGPWAFQWRRLLQAVPSCRVLAIIKSPKQHEGECHGQNLSHPHGHSQESQHLELLSSLNKAVDLWTAALKQSDSLR